MFIILGSNRAMNTLFVTDTRTDKITEITATEYFEADKNLGEAVKLAKTRMAKTLGRKGSKL